jgi:hypothetical protein
VGLATASILSLVLQLGGESMKSNLVRGKHDSQT